LRLSSGRGLTHPVRRSGHLTVCRPSGRAVHATASRAGGPAHPVRRWRLLTVCRPAGRAVRATASRAGARRTLIAGGVFALYGGRRAAGDSESVVQRPAGRRGFRVGHRAGHHPHGLLAVSYRGWPQFTTYRPGPAGRATSSTHLGPGAVHCPIAGAVFASLGGQRAAGGFRVSPSGRAPPPLSVGSRQPRLAAVHHVPARARGRVTSLAHLRLGPSTVQWGR
jgi:hypothetical protein